MGVGGTFGPLLGILVTFSLFLVSLRLHGQASRIRNFFFEPKKNRKDSSWWAGDPLCCSLENSNAPKLMIMQRSAAGAAGAAEDVLQLREILIDFLGYSSGKIVQYGQQRIDSSMPLMTKETEPCNVIPTISMYCSTTMSRFLPICCLLALALFPSACLGWSLFTRAGKDCTCTHVNDISLYKHVMEYSSSLHRRSCPSICNNSCRVQ